MSKSTLGYAFCGALLVSGALSCTFDAGDNPAYGCEGCPAGACRDGFCLARGESRDPSTGNGSDAGGAGEGGAGQGGAGEGGEGGAAGSAGSGEPAEEPCVEDDFCYEGPPDTRTLGRCRAGAKRCDGDRMSACVGQITPEEEICNGLDDDCDDATDEDLQLGSCTAEAEGACSAGMLHCELGVSVCRSTIEPAPETCDGVDEDCDGEIDEDASVPCYEGEMGCTESDGGFACEGACQPGMRVCEGGELLACAGFVAPGTEVCDGSLTGTGTDEDCDGSTDEGCDCLIGATQECYTGPSGTAGVGICRAGMQTCVEGAFGACEGAVMPGAESCANEGSDDDCDGQLDDVRERDTPCTVDENSGICRNGTRQCAGGELVCVTPVPPEGAEEMPEEACDNRDEDCDGTVDDGFDLQTDRNNCGACGNACGEGQICCGGACVNPRSDARHCRRCGNACGADMICCSGACVDPQTDEGHCGGCGNPCTREEATCCGGSCTDLMSDGANCGACGVDCSELETAPGLSCACVMGTCTGEPGGMACVP